MPLQPWPFRAALDRVSLVDVVDDARLASSQSSARRLVLATVPRRTLVRHPLDGVPIAKRAMTKNAPENKRRLEVSLV